MKKYTRIISFILVFVLIFSAGVVSSYAAIAPVQMGDVTLDKKVDVIDATYIQRYLVELETMDEYQAFAGDVDLDHSVTITDATYIQRLLAKMIEEFPSGDSIDCNVYAYGVYSDYGSGKAMVDTSVTFTAKTKVADSESGPIMYEFRINDVVVQEYSESNVLVYTFKEPGEYGVEFTMKNRIGFSDEGYMELTVVEKTEISGLYISCINTGVKYGSNARFEVVAKNGTEPYMYEYTLYKGQSIQEDAIVEKTVFSEQNTYNAIYLIEPREPYLLYVTVKDANGNTYSDSIPFLYYAIL